VPLLTANAPQLDTQGVQAKFRRFTIALCSSKFQRHYDCDNFPPFLDTHWRIGFRADVGRQVRDRY
jgi:hypothetical protein